MRLPRSLDPALHDVATELIGRATVDPSRTSPDQTPADASPEFEVDPGLEDDTDYATRPRHATTRRRAAGRGPEQTEGEFTAEALTWLNSHPETFFRKVHPDVYGGKGEPDLDGCSNGRTVKIELKVRGKRPSKAQERSMRDWQDAGALVGWARDMLELRAIFARLHDPHYRYTGQPGAPTAG